MDKSYNTLDYKYRGYRWHTLWSGSASFDTSHTEPFSNFCTYVDDSRDTLVKLRFTIEITSLYADGGDVYGVTSVDLTPPDNPTYTFNRESLAVKEYVIEGIYDKRDKSTYRFITGVNTDIYGSSAGSLSIRASLNDNYIIYGVSVPYSSVAYARGVIKKVEQYY